MEQFLDEHPSQRPGEGVSGEGRLLLQRLAAMPAELPLHVFLRELNRDPSAMLNDREYLDTWLTVGAGDNWGGVDLIASWYRRNLRIFANLRQVVAPGDRVVVVFGVGHAWSLRHFHRYITSVQTRSC